MTRKKQFRRHKANILVWKKSMLVMCTAQRLLWRWNCRSHRPKEGKKMDSLFITCVLIDIQSLYFIKLGIDFIQSSLQLVHEPSHLVFNSYFNPRITNQTVRLWWYSNISKQNSFEQRMKILFNGITCLRTQTKPEVRAYILTY